jgi:hypothetical protein
MKKIIISTILCFGLLMPTVAQDADGTKTDPTVNKRGISLLPQAGDFAIGIDATPFFKYLGGFMGGNSNDVNLTPSFDGFNQTIYAKYFLQDDVAIRAKFNLNLAQTRFKETIGNDYITITDPTNTAATVFDTQILTNNNFNLAVGYELRRGRGRVQGFYGGELLLGLGKDKSKYQYGNPITESNQTPTTSGLPPAVNQGYRLLEHKGGTSFGIGLGGFVGVEYFFAPQISIGGELGFGAAYYIKGQDEFLTEGFLGNGVQKYEYRGRNNDEFAFNSGLRTKTIGSIFVLFHF